MVKIYTVTQKGTNHNFISKMVAERVQSSLHGSSLSWSYLTNDQEREVIIGGKPHLTKIIDGKWFLHNLEVDMYYAQFYQMSVPNHWNDYKEELIEACGDRSVIIIPNAGNKKSLDEMRDIADKECRKRGYKAFSIHKGRSFLDSKELLKVLLAPN